MSFDTCLMFPSCDASMHPGGDASGVGGPLPFCAGCLAKMTRRERDRLREVLAAATEQGGTEGEEKRYKALAIAAGLIRKTIAAESEAKAAA